MPPIPFFPETEESDASAGVSQAAVPCFTATAHRARRAVAAGPHAAHGAVKPPARLLSGCSGAKRNRDRKKGFE